MREKMRAWAGRHSGIFAGIGLLFMSLGIFGLCRTYWVIQDWKDEGDYSVSTLAVYLVLMLVFVYLGWDLFRKARNKAKEKRMNLSSSQIMYKLFRVFVVLVPIAIIIVAFVGDDRHIDWFLVGVYPVVLVFAFVSYERWTGWMRKIPGVLWLEGHMWQSKTFRAFSEKVSSREEYDADYQRYLEAVKKKKGV